MLLERITLIHVAHGGVFLFLSILVVVVGLGLQEVFAVLVHLQLGNDETGRRDAHRHGCSVDLFSGESLDVNDPLLTVDCGDLSFSCLVHTPGDQNLVVLTNGHASNVVSCLQFLGKVCRHELASRLRMGAEVSLAVLAARAGN